MCFQSHAQSLSKPREVAIFHLLLMNSIRSLKSSYVQWFISKNISKERQALVNLCVNNYLSVLSDPIDPFLRQLLRVASRFWMQQASTPPNFIVIVRGQHQLRVWLMLMLTYLAFWKLWVGQMNKFQKFYYKACAETRFNLGSAVLDTYVCQR